MIDDSPRNRMKLVAALRESGHTAVEAGTGSIGFELALEHHPDLCLVDDKMPGELGLGVIERFSQDPRTAGVRCVYMQGRDDPADRVEAAGRGAVDCLVRPIASKTVCELVERLARTPG